MNNELSGISTEYIEELLTKVLMPTFLKVILPAVILTLAGVILLAITRKTLPKKLALIAELVIKLVLVAMILFATKNVIQGVKLPDHKEFSTFEENVKTQFVPPVVKE